MIHSRLDLALLSYLLLNPPSPHLALIRKYQTGHP
jgi:hypothetical protein